MNIVDIYNKYYLPENLQLHMLRVTACSKLILENWTGNKINKESILRVNLLHDMGNMAKISEESSNDINFINIRRKFIKKFGENPHEINLQIGKIEGLSEFELQILDEKSSKKNEETMKSKSFERKICAYCDQRVAPDGVKSLVQRLEDAKVRYKNKISSVWSDENKANYLIECGLEIEKQIMNNCKIKPEDINDSTIKKYVDELKKYEI